MGRARATREDPPLSEFSRSMAVSESQSTLQQSRCHARASSVARGTALAMGLGTALPCQRRRMFRQPSRLLVTRTARFGYTSTMPQSLPWAQPTRQLSTSVLVSILRATRLPWAQPTRQLSTSVLVSIRARGSTRTCRLSVRTPDFGLPQRSSHSIGCTLTSQRPARQTATSIESGGPHLPA